MRRFALVLLALALTGCGAHKGTDVKHVLGAQVQPCTEGELRPLGSARTAYAGSALHGAVAYAKPGGAVVARFGPKNVNGYPTVFSILGATVRNDCTPRWYHVQVPVKPNGKTAFVRARSLVVETVPTRITVDVSRRRLTLFRNGKRELTATVAVGAPSTPTPTGRFYVNQRLVPTDTQGPYG